MVLIKRLHSVSCVADGHFDTDLTLNIPTTNSSQLSFLLSDKVRMEAMNQERSFHFNISLDIICF